MSATILDGKKLAETVRAEARAEASAFRDTHGRPPGIEVVLVGEDPASQIYTRNKEKASNEVGMRGELHALPATTSESDLLSLLDRLNADEGVDGIQVQLPLPEHIDEQKVLDRVDPQKDVDGFHPVNVGLLSSGRPALVPCTPLGCMRLLDLSGIDPKGARAVVVGRSNIVGKPVAQLLLGRHCTVTIAHSRTKDLASVCREADILVAAVGKAQMIRGDWVKPGAVVIDVGINRVDGKVVGDVAFEEAKEVAGYITPVPGGVGPLTIAYLLKNTVAAAGKRVDSRQSTVDRPSARTT